MARRTLHVGIVGAGIGGLTAAIASARAGAQVTILESALELGEIGAGIQMLPNVSRFLLRWGVDKIIGDNLVSLDECNTYSGPDAKLVSRTDPKVLTQSAGFPWQVVRRDHLHSGLTESARQHGVNLVTGMKVCDLSYVGDVVRLETTSGKIYTFDLVVGADGIRSFVRQTLFPNIVPKAPSKVAAYRGVLSYDKIFAEVPEARAYLRNSMDVWIGNSGYILTYPISGGKELNIVTAFCKDDYVTKMENVDIDEFRGYYKDYSPIIKQILGLVGYTQRWPLLQMPPMKSWSNDTKNVVLLGDAVHCMQNHMAQGAATAMEDGAFLGAVIGEVVRGVVSICEAVEIYEKRRMPKAWIKQQISFTSGLVNMATGQMARDRDVASKPEIDAHYHNPVASPALSPTYRSWQYFCNPTSVPGVFYYDAEGDADNAICEYLQGKGEVDDLEMLSTGLKNKWMGYVTDNGLRDTKEDANFHRELNEADYARHGKGL